MNNCHRWFLLLALLPVSTGWALRPDEESVKEPGVAATARSVRSMKATTAAQRAGIQKAESRGWWVAKEPGTDRPITLRGKAIEDPSTTVPAVSERRAREVLGKVSGVFGIVDADHDFSLRRTQKDADGTTHLRMAQRHQGLRVVGGEMSVHFDAQGKAYQVGGTYQAISNLSTNPSISAAEASLLALANVTGAQAGLTTGSPELVIWAMSGSPRLAYQISLKGPDGRWMSWVDALTGEILLAFDNRHRVAAPTTSGADTTITGSILAREGGASASLTGWRESNGLYYLYNKTRRWFVYNVATSGYADNNTYAFRSSSAWGTSDRTAMSAARNFDLTQQYFQSRHSRFSFNNAGIYARANVHEGVNYVNAYWDGSDFHFGDGDGYTSYALAVLDVAAHEFTHAVTENTADLTYYGESGALNESFSDIFGACVEFYAQPDGRSLYPNVQSGYSDWLMGEDCWISSKSLRDMRNPRNTSTVGSDGVQPSRYRGTYWYSGTGDNGGVHYNSGVQNFFFYLLSEGGSGNNDGIAYNVTGIGIANAERVAYRALTVYCGPNTDYPAARAAWISAAQDLNVSWVSSVQAAWDAAGVTGSSGAGDSWDPADDTGSFATPLTPSTTLQSHGPHTLSSSDLYDWFAFYLQAGQTYTFHTQGSAGDNYGELYTDTAGSTRVAYDDDSGGDLQFSITYTPSASRWHYLRVRGYSTGASLQYTLKYQQGGGSSSPSDLAAALDAESLTWSAGGDLPWAGQSSTTHDGVDAGASGAIGHSQSSWFETTVQGPGTLSFWWRVSSEYGYDYQRFQLNGVDQFIRSGEGAWEFKSVSIPTGSHALRWLYTKDSSVISGSDQAWVDQVQWQPAGSGATRAPNDYNGDGISDLPVYYYGYWFVQSLPSGEYLAWDEPWGFTGCRKVPGDYDGDGRHDLAVYDPGTGRWYIRSLDGTILAYALAFGYSGALPVPGDFNGDGASDLAIYEARTGRWFVRTLSGEVVLWDARWGFSTAEAVPGDYDGDGRDDLAVRDLNTSRWYIRTSTGSVLAWNLPWGFRNAASVPGDFNGDGRADLAVYSRDTFRWYIRTMEGTALGWDIPWGYSRTRAVPGDYDGNGRADLAMKDILTGQWYIRSLTGSVLAWNYYWGWSGEAVPQR